MGGTFRVTVAPLVTAGGGLAGSVLVAHDVSEERRIEAERAALREALAQSQAMTHLVAGIAHELNNPLQARAGPRGTPAPHRDAPAARQRLVAPGLPRVRPRRAHRPQPPLSRGVRSRGPPARERQCGGAQGPRPARRVRAAARASSSNATLPSGLPRVSGDGLLLQQAVHNHRAERGASPRRMDGGRIDVRTSCSRSRPVRDGQGARTTAPGFRPTCCRASSSRSSRPEKRGAGSGSPMVRRIVREHGGDISRREPTRRGRGVHVRLPASSVIQ